MDPLITNKLGKMQFSRSIDRYGYKQAMDSIEFTRKGHGFRGIGEKGFDDAGSWGLRAPLVDSKFVRQPTENGGGILRGEVVRIQTKKL